MMLSRWQHMLFLTSVPLKERPASTYPSTRHHCENLRTWGKAGAPPWTTETRDSIRKVRGIVGSDHIFPPPGWHISILRGPMVSLVGKREPKVDIQLPWHCSLLPQRPTQVLLHGDHRELDLTIRDQVGYNGGRFIYTAIKSMYDKPEVTSYSMMKG